MGFVFMKISRITTLKLKSVSSHLLTPTTAKMAELLWKVVSVVEACPLLESAIAKAGKCASLTGLMFNFTGITGQLQLNKPISQLQIREKEFPPMCLFVLTQLNVMIY